VRGWWVPDEEEEDVREAVTEAKYVWENQTSEQIVNEMEEAVEAHFGSTAFRDDGPKREEETSESFFSFPNDDEKPQSLEIQRLLVEIRLLKEHNQNLQATIDLIMSKYRKQISELIRLKTELGVELSTTRTIAFQIVAEESRKRIESAEDMKRVMKAALDTDRRIFLRTEEIMSQLAMENKQLRELLSISGERISIQHAVSTCEDKSIQTDCYEEEEEQNEHTEMDTKSGTEDITLIDDADENENDDTFEEYFSDDSCSFHSAVGFDSDS